jgi:hypothetical protein
MSKNEFQNAQATDLRFSQMTQLEIKKSPVKTRLLVARPRVELGTLGL